MNPPDLPPSRPPSPAPAASAGQPSFRAPRIMKAEGVAPPVPSAIMRSLLSTRPWAVLGAVGLLILGVLTMFAARKSWRDLRLLDHMADSAVTTGLRWLMYADVVVNFALAAACVYAVPRLFRYAGAITRLRDARRMAELENALRHQRAVWRAFGIAGIFWLLTFVSQIIYMVESYRSQKHFEEETGEIQLPG